MERLICNQQVVGSIPIASSIVNSAPRLVLGAFFIFRAMRVNCALGADWVLM